jgi:ubiquinol-cytochrome c reductase cytochrome b subunit
MTSTSKLRNWIEERFPLRSTIKFIIDEDIPGRSSYFYALGSATLFVFSLQILSGVWQLFYYVPTTDHAYSSVSYLRTSVPFGWLIHGIHYWGAQAMIVLVGLHLIRVFIWGAYKHPRELVWLAGVLLLILTAVMSFTGVLLPWDEVGYFAAKVGTNIASTIPVIGTSVKNFLLGGTEIGQLTLSRFFILHIAIVPFILLTFIIIHLMAFRQFGSIGPWKKAKRAITTPFWPDQVAKDIIISILIMLILIVFSAYITAPFSGPADPLDTSYHPKPEWNFLFLYQALKAFKGNWEPIGTILFPVLLVLFMLSVPFMDKYKETNPLKRPAVLILGIVFVGGIIFLTIEGKGKVPETGTVSPVQSKIVITENAPVNIKQGHDLFISNNCVICHSINGSGGKIGPDLSHETARGMSTAKIVEQIKDPKKLNPKSVMPAFSSLPPEQIEAIAAYLLNVDKGSSIIGGNNLSSQTSSAQSSTSSENYAGNKQSNINIRSLIGPAASYIGDPRHGEILYRQQCEGCHGVNGEGKVPNPGSSNEFVPALKPIQAKYFSQNVTVFVNNIDTIIQHGSIPAGPAPSLKMLAFGDAGTLTQQQIAQIESYILDLNSVDRATILNPGIKPKLIVQATISLFIMLCLVLLLYRYITSRRTNSAGN